MTYSHLRRVLVSKLKTVSCQLRSLSIVNCGICESSQLQTMNSKREVWLYILVSCQEICKDYVYVYSEWYPFWSWGHPPTHNYHSWRDIWLSIIWPFRGLFHFWDSKLFEHGFMFSRWSTARILNLWVKLAILEIQKLLASFRQWKLPVSGVWNCEFQNLETLKARFSNLWQFEIWG